VKLRALVAAVGVLLAVAPAAAQETVPPPPLPEESPGVVQAPARFGSRAQIALSTDLQLTALNVKTGSAASTNNIALRPALDVFVLRNLSVGGSVTVVVSTGPNGATGFALQLRSGYNIRLGEALSLWPRLGVAYSNTGFSSNGTSMSISSIPLSFIAPVLWHPTAHFFIGAGPVFETELARSQNGMSVDKTTQFGIRSLLGGTFGGG
jgi:hypothetical protein